jgi:plasmid stabilization system protein ParE
MNAKKRLEFTKRFFKKLALIEEYIALDNPAAAKKVAQYIYDVAESLEAFPMLGKLSDGVAGARVGSRQISLHDHVPPDRLKNNRSVRCPSIANLALA